MWNRISLRYRLTILTATILTAVCICLTILSIVNAEHIFYKQIDNPSIVGFSPDFDEKSPKYVPDSTIGKGNLYFFENSKQQFNQISIVYMLMFIALGTGFTYLISGKVLKPVTDLCKVIKEVDESNLNIPININNSGVEVANLTESFNHMLSKLDNAFESQKRFAHHAAHELKTPLASIMTNIEVLQMDTSPSIEEYKEVIDITKGSTERLIQLVSDLLNLNVSLIEENIQPIDAHKMFQRIFSELDAQIKEKDIFTLNKCDCIISGDSELLFQAFFNLIQNAVKYNKFQGSITVSSEKNKIIIQDTGIGMPASSLKNIFEPFYCVDLSRSRKLGGSGLGLSVVKAIIEKHEGTICVESEVGERTTITVEI